MYYFIRLLAIYSLFCVHASYAAQEITMLYPYHNSRVVDAEKLRSDSVQGLKDIFVQALEKPESLKVYAFDSQSERRGTPEIYDGLAHGSGKFASIKPLLAYEILAPCLRLNQTGKREPDVYLMLGTEYYKSPIVDPQDKDKNWWERDKLELWEKTASGDHIFRPNGIQKKDILIYILGDDFPAEHPVYSSVKLDAEWHANRINQLREQCGSMLILISKGRYDEMAPIIIDQCQSINVDEATVIVPSASYRPLFILGFGVLVCGLLYTYFKNGSALNSSLFSANDM